ncbi:MAG: hypothetical protein ACE5J7_03025 [Candidatus Aenigmatarchaeota archaeon]
MRERTVRKPIPDATDMKEVEESIRKQSKKRKVKKLKRKPQPIPSNLVPRNEKYYKAWVDYFRHFNARDPEIMAALIDFIKFSCRGIDIGAVNKDTFIQTLKIVGKEDEAIVYESLRTIPSEFNLTDVALTQMGIIASEFRKKNVTDVNEELFHYTSDNLKFYITPYILAKWMTEGTAGVYLALLDSLDEDYHLEFEWKRRSDPEYDYKEYNKFKKISSKLRNPKTLAPFVKEGKDVTAFLNEYTIMFKEISRMKKSNHDCGHEPHNPRGTSYCRACKMLDNFYKEKK